MKKTIPLLLAFVLAISVIVPSVIQADSRLDKINKQIEEIKKREQEAKRKVRDAERKINRINRQTKNMERDIKELIAYIDKKTAEIIELNKQINTAKQELEHTTVQLAEAEDRVMERDRLLKTRVRLMYENGSVSYLDVLLGSTSFVDFLDRLEALEMIVEQDQLILQANIKDRDTISQLKVEVEQKLDGLSVMFEKAEKLKMELIQQEKEKEVAIASLKAEKKELEEYREDEEEAAISLATQRQKLMQERQKLIWSGGKFAWPVPDSRRITSNFGLRSDPFTGRTRGHKGMDIAAPKGTPIVAAESGTVIVAQYLRGYGNTVIINHGSGIWTLYAHMSRITVSQGQSVTKGSTKIGEVGSTGRSTGNHLHFEVRKNEQPMDPMKYLR